MHFNIRHTANSSMYEDIDGVELRGRIYYVNQQWDTVTISVLQHFLSGLRSVIFSDFCLTVDQSSQDFDIPKATAKHIELWKCIDVALSHPRFSHLTHFDIRWRCVPRNQLQEYKVSLPELFQQLLPQFSSRVTTRVEVVAATWGSILRVSICNTLFIVSYLGSTPLLQR